MTSGAADMSSEPLNFDEIDADLQKFAQVRWERFGVVKLLLTRFEVQDEVIRDALSREVDLRKYSKQVDGELRHMEMLSIADC